MAQARVLIYLESRYKADRKRIKATVFDVLAGNKIESEVEVSIALVGDRKMAALNKKYRDKEGTTNILSFPLAEGEQTVMETKGLKLGDIVLSYPQVIREAARDDMLVDDKIEELIRHGLLHLLGIHHT
jgi:rRNA maturation RNase YbeY